MAALTKAQVEKAVKAGCPQGRSHAMLWDADLPGFGLKIRATGSATWLLTYRPKGQGRKATARTLTIGAWPKVTVDAARAVAMVHMGAIAGGKDPAVDLQTERNRERKLLTAVLDAYEADLQRRRIVNVKTAMSSLRRGLEPLFKSEVDKVTRAEIVEQIDALEASDKPGAASDLRKHSRAMLEWAVSKGLAPFNPLAGLRRQRATRAQRLEGEASGRALTDIEITRLWSTAGGMGPFGGIVRLGLLTAMRRGELAGLRWEDIHADRIILHAANTKTGARHEVPLTPAMRAVISAQPRHAGSDLVFGSTRRPGVEISGWSKFIAKLVAGSKVKMTLHDLRRTARTIMSRKGIATDIAELAIGHVRSDLVATYNKDDAWAGRVTAFEAVSNHVASIITGPIKPAAAGAGVVAMPRARKKASA